MSINLKTMRKDLFQLMENKLLHTPEGVRDIYNTECRQKLHLQDELHNIFRQYGFEDIQTPTFEYFDVFSKKIGTIPSKDLYKFFDREGNTLVLRPDYTPSIARCASKYYMDETMPLRFCYSGNVFINETAAYQGRLKETTQLGAELINDVSVEADAEMASLIVRLLLQSGLESFQLEIGNVEFFKDLLEEAELDEDTVATLRDLISNKNYFGVEDLLTKQNISEDLKNVLLQIPQMFGSVDILHTAKTLTKNKRSLAAIDRLLEIYEILKMYRLEKYISFDLGMISKYNYYTGVIFRAFTKGTGEAIVKGGRYDSLLSLFGKQSGAIGFSLMLDSLFLALKRQNIHIATGNKKNILVYTKEVQKNAILYADIHRKSGEYIDFISYNPNLSKKDYTDYAKRCNAGKLYLYEKGTTVTVIDIIANEESAIDISDELAPFGGETWNI